MSVQWFDFIPFVAGLANLYPAHKAFFIYRKKHIECKEKYPDANYFGWWADYLPINFGALLICWLIGVVCLIN